MNRWRLVYLDFVDNAAVQELIIKYADLNSLTPSSEMCCVYLGQSSTNPCACHGKISVNFKIFAQFYKKKVKKIIFDFLQSNSGFGYIPS